MDDDGSDKLRLKLWRFIKTRWVELVGVVFIAAVSIDLAVYSGVHFVNQTTSWASTNDGLASLLLSGGLLFAYLLQFRTQDRQRVLMNQQKQIMDAGYTPLIGVTEQNIEDNSSNPKITNTESLQLTIVNRGNSLATDLQLHFFISYGSDNQRYINHFGPLRRTDDALWWNSRSGGSISPEEGEIEFSIPAEVSDTKPNQDEAIDIADAIDAIFESGNDISEIKIATQLQYKDIKGNEKEIDLTIYTIKSSSGNANLKLGTAADSRAVRNSEESNEVETIKG